MVYEGVVPADLQITLEHHKMLFYAIRFWVKQGSFSMLISELSMCWLEGFVHFEQNQASCSYLFPVFELN